MRYKNDRENVSDQISLTLNTISHSLETMGYKVKCKVLDAKNFDLKQTRNRIYIVGTQKGKVFLIISKKAKFFGRI